MDSIELKEILAGILAEDRGKVPAVRRPQCATCKHMIPRTLTCNVFPNGIPKDILHGKADHTKPYPGDGGVQYDPRDPAKPRIAPRAKNQG